MDPRQQEIRHVSPQAIAAKQEELRTVNQEIILATRNMAAREADLAQYMRYMEGAEEDEDEERIASLGESVLEEIERVRVYQRQLSALEKRKKKLEEDITVYKTVHKVRMQHWQQHWND